MRRVLVVSRMFPHPEEPCSGPFIHEQVKALRRRGLDVRVVSGRPFPMYLRRPLGLAGRWRAWRQAWARLDWTERDGVPVLYVPHHVGWFARLLRQDDPYHDAVWRCRRRVEEAFDFDLIHAHEAHPDGFAALALARRYGKPLVITVHTGLISSRINDRRVWTRTLTALTAAERVWCVSDALAREVRSYFPADRQPPIGTLYNGVDTNLFHPPRQWQPDPAAPRFLFIGLLVGVKNLPVLLDAFARLHRLLPGARLDIVGDGPLRGLVEERTAALELSGVVRLLGGASRAEVAVRLRDECDVLVLPSRSETFGVVLIEALASGKPVVASRCGGPESIVTDPALGALCAPNDPEALARCLHETAARLPQFDAGKIRAHAVHTFDYDILAHTLLEQYQEVCSGASRQGLPAA